jgi:hypothetical protein
VNRNQQLVLWIGGILVALGVIGGSYAGAGIMAILTGLAWRKFDTRGRKPENMVVRSVRCGQCGAIGEPHWAKCPACGAAGWK